MATRFYLEASGAGAAPISPAFDASWEVSTNADRINTHTDKAGSSNGNKTSAVGNGSNPHDQVLRAHISRPLAAQTIAGTVKGQLRVAEGNAALNARAQVVIRVLSNDGTVVRGTLVASDASAISSEFIVSAGTPQNRKYPLAAVSPVTVTPVVLLGGDRLMIETGARIHSTDVTNTFIIRYGSSAATDLGEDETDQTNQNGWLEFSQTLVFLTGGGMMMGVG